MLALFMQNTFMIVASMKTESHSSISEIKGLNKTGLSQTGAL